jgi:hypothetical protein
MRATWGVLLLACAACGDDDGGTTFDARAGFDAPLAVDARPVDAAGAVFDASIADGPVVVFDAAPVFDALPGFAPVIHAIVITHAQPCTAGDPSATTVEIVASDNETPADQLVYSATTTGGSSGCGAITQRVSTLNCPQLAPYPYTATVRDSDNRTASRGFTINVCQNTPDAGPF